MSAKDDVPGVGRRRVLECLGWAGGGLVWSVAGGIPAASLLGGTARAATGRAPNFVQISDTHIGFAKDANPDPVATLKIALGLIQAMPTRPDFIVHTGDVSHLSKPAELDTAKSLIEALGIPLFVIPGEHDMLSGDGATFRERFVKDGGQGWFSFDHAGIHVVGLVNVMNLKAGGLGHLGNEQLVWLANDLKRLGSSTPIVVLAHIPLWTVDEAWGWGTDDAANALALLARFGSVTVLNGHIHQIQQTVEGNTSFYTARSTAYPQPAPGTAPNPGPKKVPADELPHDLGIRRVTRSAGASHERPGLMIADRDLATA